MATKAKGHRGKPPKGEEWDTVAEVKSDGRKWTIYAKDQGHGTGWWTVKVAANWRAPNKANYWWAVHAPTGRTGMAKQREIMRQYRPELLALVDDALARHLCRELAAAMERMRGGRA